MFNLDPRALLLTEGEKIFFEEQSKAPLIGAFVLLQGVSRRHKVQIASFWL